jgi:outer membrane protein TolC
MLSRRRSEGVFLRRGALPGCLFVLCVQAVAQDQAEALVLSPDQAVMYALERKLDLKAARLAPQIATLEVKAAEAAWSPHLSGSVSFAGTHSPALSVLDPISGSVTKEIVGGTSVTQALPWGFSWAAGWDTERLTSNSPLLLFNTATGTVAMTQHLVKGFTIDEARANRLIAVKGRIVSDAGLASSVAATTYAVLRAYWTWIYTREYLAVEQRSLALARSLLQDDRERASLGKIASVDVIEVEAEVARRSDVILSAARDVANAQDEVRLLIFAPQDPEQIRPLAPPSELAEPGCPEGRGIGHQGYQPEWSPCHTWVERLPPSSHPRWLELQYGASLGRCEEPRRCACHAKGPGSAHACAPMGPRRRRMERIPV